MVTYKILGWRDASFADKDGQKISGYRVYVSAPVDPQYGSGESSKDFFLSQRKFSDLHPVVGMKVDLRYSAYKAGKVDEVIKL